MAQLMPLPLTVSCSSKIQIGFTFLVPAYPGCPGKEAVKWLCSSSSLEFDSSVYHVDSSFFELNFQSPVNGGKKCESSEQYMYHRSP